jgi:hypothetical protein
MTYFFTTPQECGDCLADAVVQLALDRDDEQLPGGATRSWVWERDTPESGLPRVSPRVLIDHPHDHVDVLTAGWVAFNAKGYVDNYPDIASAGRRLQDKLTRRIRKIATAPVFAVAHDSRSRAAKPSAWASRAALDSGLVLRQFHGSGGRYEP